MLTTVFECNMNNILGLYNEYTFSGALHPGSKVGIYACDPEAYTVFQDVFNPIILEYHKVDKIDHPEPTFGTPDQIAALENIDPEGKMVISTRIRVARSHQKYPFPPVANAEVG